MFDDSGTRTAVREERASSLEDVYSQRRAAQSVVTTVSGLRIPPSENRALLKHHVERLSPEAWVKKSAQMHKQQVVSHIASA